MRICNIIQCANLGGMEKSSITLLVELKARGHDVELLSLNPLQGLRPLLDKHSIPAEGLSYRGAGGWRSVSSFKSRLTKVDCDAILMTGHNLLATEALGSFKAGRRVLSIHFHHFGVKPRWMWSLIYRRALTRFDAIAFPSDFIRAEAEAIFPAIRPIAHTIGCPVELFEPATLAEKQRARRSLGLPENTQIVGNAGWLIRRKRFDIFLRVARNVLSSNPDVLFAIAGDGPEHDNLRALAERLGISDHIIWLGWQQDLTAFYQSLDLVLFNSDWDAMGRTPLEALSHGIPVVTSVLHGGLTEIIDHENYGPVFKTHDIEGLTDAACSLLQHPQLAAHLVGVGRRRLQEVASVSGHADYVIGLLSGDGDQKRTGTA